MFSPILIDTHRYMRLKKLRFNVGVAMSIFALTVAGIVTKGLIDEQKAKENTPTVQVEPVVSENTENTPAQAPQVGLPEVETVQVEPAPVQETTTVTPAPAIDTSSTSTTTTPSTNTNTGTSGNTDTNANAAPKNNTINQPTVRTRAS